MRSNTTSDIWKPSIKEFFHKRVSITMKAKIIVTLKSTILDPQGKAIQQALQNLGYTEVKDVRVGKYIEIELVPKSPEAAQKEITQMCEKLLANTVIEEYRFEINDK